MILRRRRAGDRIDGSFAGGISAPPDGSYSYVRAVDFTSNAADGDGQKMNTTLDLGGGSNYTFMVVVRPDNWTPCVFASQWGTENSWILVPSDAPTYGAGGDGYRLWLQNGATIAAAQLNLSPLPASGSLVQIITSYDGTQALEANRVRMWYASGSQASLTEGTITIFNPFGPSEIPTAFQASVVDTQIGGASYSTAIGINGLMYDFAIWNSTLTPAQILTLRASGAPTNPSLISGLSNWWRFGNGPSDAGTSIIDVVGGLTGTLTNEGNPATNPTIITL